MTTVEPVVSATPRIVQMLEDNSAAELLSLFALQGHLIVVLDDGGRLWSYGPARQGAVRTWHRLPLPPLPEGGDNA